MLVYRGMDIGTAKPSRAELEEIPHHLIDIRDPDEAFTAGDFVRLVNAALEDIHSRGKRAIIVGGTGFYLKALCYGMWEGPAADLKIRAGLDALDPASLFARLKEIDEASAVRIGMNDRYRLTRSIELFELTGKTPSQLAGESPQAPDPRFELWIVDRETEALNLRIRQRTTQMLSDGFIEEVRSLREKYPNARPLAAIGYQEACAFLDGIAPPGRKVAPGMAGLQQEIELGTRQLVKKQRTWFRNLHGRLGKSSKWFQLEDVSTATWKIEFERWAGR